MRNLAAAILLLFLIFSCESSDRPAIENPVAGDHGGARGPAKDGAASACPFLEAVVPNCPGMDPALIPPIAEFEWQTIAGADDPDLVRWILVSTSAFNHNWDETLDYIRNNPDAPEWSAWQTYDPANNIGTSWTTPPLDYGPYVFAVHGWDVDSTACQEFDFGRNAIRVLVSARSTGPILTLTSDLVGPIVTSTLSTPLTIVDVDAGVPIEFCWNADASAYCGVVIGYRYGWNIKNLLDDSQWDVDWTPFDGGDTCSSVRTFYYGTHTFTVEVMDNSGFRSRIPVKINMTPHPVSLTLDILPGECPNQLNPWVGDALSATLPGSAALDVSTGIQLGTVTLNTTDFADVGLNPGQYRIWDSTTIPDGSQDPNCVPSGADGHDDLNLKFDMAPVAQWLGTAAMGDEVTLVVSGLLADGTPFKAEDRVWIVGVDIDDPPVDRRRGPDTEILGILNTYYVNNQKHEEWLDITDTVLDTVPFGSWINVLYRGNPDTDTSACQDMVNLCIRYQKSFKWRSSKVPSAGETTAWLPEWGEENNYFGTNDSTSMNLGTAEYLFRVRAVDEFTRVDPTPAAVRVFGNFPPMLDDFGIEHHDGTVAGDGDSIVWDWWNPANFHGASGDTLDLTDPPNIWIIRDFFFLISGSGRDHPKEASTGGVKSWLYSFTRSEDPSYVQPFARSGYWADGATVNAVSDTVWLRVRYSLVDDPGGLQAYADLPDWVHRSYDFGIRGRDTGSMDEFEQFMFVNGDRWLINRYNVFALGRETTEGAMSFYLTITR
ncbi:MAG: hypothetical protein JSW50_08745 [Candidatus Latescibacterota bacterium]|nr:MAG: hypothetical protein JSW50_08745 [Candidatus Latescibacterota bacterium]